MNDLYNPHLQKLDLIQEARKKWDESEWILAFLRSEGNPVPEPTEHELLQWMRNLTRQT
jgi:hypothetical protein